MKKKRGRPRKQPVEVKAEPKVRRAPFHMTLIGPKGPRMFKPGEIIPDGYK